MIRNESKMNYSNTQGGWTILCFGVSVSNQLSILSYQTLPNNTKLIALVLYRHETWHHKRYFGTGCWGDDVYLRQRK